METKVDTKETSTGTKVSKGEELLAEKSEPVDPFLTLLDKCDAEFNGSNQASNETQPLPMQPSTLTAGRKDSGTELDYSPQIIFDDETNGNINFVNSCTTASVISRNREGAGLRSLRLGALQFTTCFIIGRSYKGNFITIMDISPKPSISITIFSREIQTSGSNGTATTVNLSSRNGTDNYIICF